jgi:hypothetical protein
LSESNRKPSRRSQPVSAHPLFPAYMRFWFAALLGLSCLALHPAVLDRIVLASGIGAVIAAAAPPLDMGARIVLAVSLAVLGAVIGTVLARLVAPRNAASAPSETISAPIAAGFDPLLLDAIELTESSADAEATPAELESATALDDLAFADELEFFSAAPAEFETPAEIDLELAEPEPAPLAEIAAFEPLVDEPELPAGLAEPELAPEMPAIGPTPIREVAPLGSAAHRIATGNLEDLSPVEMLERLALSMQQRDRPELAAAEESHETAEFDDFDDLEDEAEPADLPDLSHDRRPMASLTPLAEFALADDETLDGDEEDEYEAENDVREEVYSSLLRVTRHVDPGIRLAPIEAADADDEGEEDYGNPLAMEPAPGGRVTKLQRLSGNS